MVSSETGVDKNRRIDRRPLIASITESIVTTLPLHSNTLLPWRRFAYGHLTYNYSQWGGWLRHPAANHLHMLPVLHLSTTGNHQGKRLRDYAAVRLAPACSPAVDPYIEIKSVADHYWCNLTPPPRQRRHCSSNVSLPQT
jgi:hypothetical protein